VSEFLALIDIGSNAVRCLLARVVPGVGFEILFQERAQTRLSGGRPGLLPQPGVEESLALIRRFLRTVRREYQTRVLAVATAAVREAANRDVLLEALRREEGVLVQVLSGEEEARLGALAAMRSLSFRDGVVIDLGGGSLQVAFVREREVVSTASLPLGVVRTTQRFFSNDPPTRQEITALREAIVQHTTPVLPSACLGKEMVGLGGTVRAFASMHLAACDGSRPLRQGLRIRRTDIVRIREQLAGLPTRDRRRIPGLKDERSDIILAGAVVIEEVMVLGAYRTLTVCDGGVRNGLLLSETFNQGGLKRE
jgi:exopolyphosphatase/guanosine-5'-triphosphate,3'-diphosphate pyrophosphatase